VQTPKPLPVSLDKSRREHILVFNGQIANEVHENVVTISGTMMSTDNFQDEVVGFPK
jgi:hypothetical protein